MNLTTYTTPLQNNRTYQPLSPPPPQLYGNLQCRQYFIYEATLEFRKYEFARFNRSWATDQPNKRVVHGEESTSSVSIN